jgi:hypothetical protein
MGLLRIGCLLHINIPRDVVLLAAWSRCWGHAHVPTLNNDLRRLTGTPAAAASSAHRSRCAHAGRWQVAAAI